MRRETPSTDTCTADSAVTSIGRHDEIVETRLEESIGKRRIEKMDDAHDRSRREEEREAR